MYRKVSATRGRPASLYEPNVDEIWNGTPIERPGSHEGGSGSCCLNMRSTRTMSIASCAARREIAHCRESTTEMSRKSANGGADRARHASGSTPSSLMRCRSLSTSSFAAKTSTARLTFHPWAAAGSM
eukprot:3757924-Prymnesium_polylepis.1